jgi:hypothetical protein
MMIDVDVRKNALARVRESLNEICSTVLCNAIRPAV